MNVDGNQQLTQMTDDLIADSRVACCAMRYFQPPATNDRKFDLAVDAVTLSACRTLESAIAVFELGDHNSAAALTRKALECAYVLAILARKGKHAVDLLDTWCARNMASGLRTIMSTQRGIFHSLDQSKVIEALKEYERLIPNGDLNRVPEKMLADWAGLSEVHEHFYSMLNSHAHFDLFESLALQSQIRLPEDSDVVAILSLDRALVGAKLQEVTLLVAHALLELGAAKMAGLLPNQEAKFRRINERICDLAAARATRDERFGRGSATE